MGGLKVLESVLGSLDEVESFGVRNFKEVVSLSQEDLIRNVFYTGMVLGVQEFEYSGSESLTGAKRDGEARGTYGTFREDVHLYDVMKVLRGVCPNIESLVFRDDSYRGGKESGVFESVPAFDSVCRGYDVQFTEGLKPRMKYSIVTPAVKIEFPVWSSWRGIPMGFFRSTDGTVVVDDFFSITPNSEMSRIFRAFYPMKTAEEFLHRSENAFEQARRVVAAVKGNSDFGELVDSYVKTNSGIVEQLRKEDCAAIR